MAASEHSSWRKFLRLHHRQRRRSSPSFGGGAGERHALVLAGGRGVRLARMTRQLTGAPIPKQFCAFTPDDVTLLQQTTQRARLMTDGPVRVVVCREHEQLAQRQLEGHPSRRLLVQPCDRGTAVGLLFGLVDLVIHTPDARVIVLPADHGFSDEAVLARTVDDAFAATETHPERILLLAAEAHRPATDYGWIVALREAGEDLSPIHGFVEKPDLARAARLLVAGGAWSTMMLVATGRALLGLFERHVPRLVELFVRHAGLSSDDRLAFLERAYASLPSVDLSADLLERDGQLWRLRLPRSAGWTDLGTEGRMCAWLRSRGHTCRPSGVGPAEVVDDHSARKAVA